MASLSVNLSLVAALRETRPYNEPDPAQAAVLAELAGADGLVVQLRRDRKLIRDRDLYLLKGVCKTKLIVAVPPVDEIVDRLLEVKPAVIVLVADHADHNSPVSTIDFIESAIDYSGVISRCQSADIAPCIFVEPRGDDVKGAAKVGASAVLINAGGYTGARTIEDAQSELDRLDRASQIASKAGLTVFCGRGLNYKNIQPLVELGTIDEFIMGHAICARSMLVGMQKAVSDAINLVRSGPMRS